MVYLIEKHHRGMHWDTETYAIFEDKERMFNFIKEQIGDDYYNDWLNGIYSVYKINNPLLEDKEEINLKDELLKRFPHIEDLLRYKSVLDDNAVNKHLEVMTALYTYCFNGFVSKKIKPKEVVLS